MGLKQGVYEDENKTNEKWINDGEKTSDVDRRAPPEQGEASTSVEVVTEALTTRRHSALCGMSLTNDYGYTDTIHVSLRINNGSPCPQSCTAGCLTEDYPFFGLVDTSHYSNPFLNIQ
jgi:hypothetical protein